MVHPALHMATTKNACAVSTLAQALADEILSKDGIGHNDANFKILCTMELSSTCVVEYSERVRVPDTSPFFIQFLYCHHHR